MPVPSTGRGASTAATDVGTEFAHLLQELRADRYHTQLLLQAALKAFGGNIKIAQQHHAPDPNARKQAVETLHVDTKQYFAHLESQVTVLQTSFEDLVTAYEVQAANSSQVQHLHHKLETLQDSLRAVTGADKAPCTLT